MYELQSVRDTENIIETAVGFHMGHRYSGTFAYTDDLTYLSPGRYG